MKIRPVGAEAFHADVKLRVAFHSFTKDPKSDEGLICVKSIRGANCPLPTSSPACR